jgi:hypothetical protein
MAEKRIYVKTNSRTRHFTWSDHNGGIWDDDDGKIGTAQSLTDAIALAKSYTSGSDHKVEVKDKY